MKLFFICFLMMTFLTVSAEPITPEMCKQKVVDAVQLIEKEGAACYDKIRDKAGPFWFGDGEGYIFIIDMDGVTIVQSAKTSLEGKNLIDVRDSKGVYFFVNFIELASSKGEGWVEYSWPKPGQEKPAPKISYVKKVTVGGKDLVVGAGMYDVTLKDIKAKFPKDNIYEE